LDKSLKMLFITAEKITEITFWVKLNVAVVASLEVLEFRFSSSSLHLANTGSCLVGLHLAG